MKRFLAVLGREGKALITALIQTVNINFRFIRDESNRRLSRPATYEIEGSDYLQLCVATIQYTVLSANKSVVCVDLTAVSEKSYRLGMISIIISLCLSPLTERDVMGEDSKL